MTLEGMAASSSFFALPGEENTPRQAWKWILEKLVDLPDFGINFIKEVITQVTDIEEPHCRPLLERVALRYLEEMVIANQIDTDAIPLLKALTGNDAVVPVGKVSSLKERLNKELVLRVQTEAVLAVLRKDLDKEVKDWEGFALVLQSVFTEEESDNRHLDRQRELAALLKPKNQTKSIVATYLEKYSLNKLKNDLGMFIDEKKESFQTIFLDQLARDFLEGNVTFFPEDLVEGEVRTEADGCVNLDHAGTFVRKAFESRKGLDESLHKLPGYANTDKVGHKLDLERSEHAERDKDHVTRFKTRQPSHKLSTVHCDSGNAEQNDPHERHEGNKSSKISIVSGSPAKFLRQRDNTGRAITESSPSRRGSLANNSRVSNEPVIELRGEEHDAILEELDMKAMRRGSLGALGGSSRAEGTKVTLRDSGKTKNYVILSDVDSDADTQVMQSSSRDVEDVNPPLEACQSVGHSEKEHTFSKVKDARQLLHYQGSGKGQPQGNDPIVLETRHEVGKSERPEASTEIVTSSQEGHRAQEFLKHKKTAREEELQFDSQELIPLRELGSDGHEEVCHRCDLHGKLLCCDGCPIAMHLKCVQLLGMKMPGPEDNWYCPVCLSDKAAQEAAEAEKVAADAKEKLKAFMRESTKKRSHSEGNSLQQHKQERANKQQKVSRDDPDLFGGISRLVVTLHGETIKAPNDATVRRQKGSVFPSRHSRSVCKPERDLDRALKPRHRSEKKSKMRRSGLQGHLDENTGSPLRDHSQIRKASSQCQPHAFSDLLPEEDSENQGQDPLPEKIPHDEQGGVNKKAGEKNVVDVRDDLGGALQANERILNASADREQPSSWAQIREGGNGKDTAEPLLHNNAGRKAQKSESSCGKEVLRVKELMASTSGEKEREEESFKPVAGRRCSKADRGQAEPKHGSAVLEPRIGGHGEVEVDKHDSDLEEDSDGKPEGSRRTPVFSDRCKIPGLRRKRLPWSRAEEFKLKEGVQRYSSNGTHGFHWKQILEFGYGIFDPSRTYVDLKDKWRNLVKGVS